MLISSHPAHAEDDLSPANATINAVPSLSPEELAWIKDHPVIRYGGEQDWPPYDFADNKGQHDGLSKDMLELISQHTGLKFQATLGDWNDLLDKIQHHEIDLLPVIFYSEQRSRYLRFTQPYQEMLNYFFVHEELAAHNLEDLNGKTLAIPKDYVFIDTLRKHFPKIKILEVNNLKTAVQSVIERKADVLVDTYAVLSYWLKQNAITTIKPFKILPHQETISLHMAVAEDQVLLASILDKTLASIPSQEKWQVEEKWLALDPKLRGQRVVLSPQEREWLDKHPVIRFGGDPNWLPYEAFNKQGQYIGIVAEYLALIEEKLGIHLEIIRSQSWSETVGLLEKGQLDVVSAGQGSTLPIGSQLKFTQKYLNSPIIIVMRADADYVENIEQIKSKKLAAIKDYDDVHFPGIPLLYVDNIPDGLTAVSTGKIDALFCTLAQASYHITELGINNVRIVGKTDFKTEVGFGMREEFAPLVPILNKALNAISQSEKQKIYDAWSKEKFTDTTNYRLITQIVVGFLLTLLIILMWMRLLTKEIKRRKQTEAELTALNARFTLATEAVALGIWELQLGDPAVFIADDRTLEMYGQPRKAQVTFESWLSHIHADDHAHIFAELNTVKQHGGRGRIEFRSYKPNGEIVHIYSGYRAITNADGVSSVIGVNWDITEQKMTALALETAKQQAEYANRAKSEFLANMSHEIRTPMNAIIGFTELLNEQIQDPKLKTFAQTIQAAGNNLLSLINDILDLSKIEAGKMRIEMAPTNPHDLFEELGSIFIIKMREKRLDLLLEIDTNIPPCLLMDAVRLRQILFNLIGNAVKFTDQGFIRVSAKACNTDKALSKTDLLITVQDTGIGISADQLPIIFQDFEQSQGQDHKKYGGTGLGLAISKRLTEMMGGSISVNSQLGKGTTLTVKLTGIAVTTPKNPQQKPQDNPQTAQFLPATVLVVDDIASNRELLKASIATQPITVIEAENGLQAVTLASQHAFNLILMDIRMPVMDGYEACEKIKAIVNVPIIALTASIMMEEYQQLKNHHFDGYLQKPVHKKDLINEMLRFLGHKPHLHLPDEAQPLLTIPPEQQLLLPKLLGQLETASAQYQLCSKSNNISELKKFADKLQYLVESCPLPVITDYIAELHQHIDAFDIIAIKQTIHRYPHLIQELSNLAESQEPPEKAFDKHA
ncbi:transporter substrate-binding domain-containing protein [Methylosoma difficile]